jgi:hypothetical protein
MFDAIFNSMKAWNMIGMLLGGLIVLGISALLIWDFIAVRLSRRRAIGEIVGVRVTGVRELGPDQVAEAEQKPAAGGKPRESFSALFRRSPKNAIFGSALALLILCVPLSFLVFGAWQSYDVLTLRTTGLVAPAVVVDIESKFDSESGTTYAPILAFTDLQGKRWQLADRLSSGNRKFKRGDRTEVYYDRENPQRFILKNFWRYMIFNLVFMAIPFLLYFLLAFTSRRNFKARLRKERVKKHPAGRMLTDDEIRERLHRHDRQALLWSPLLALLALGLFAGGWYLYLDLQGFSGKALSGQGEVVRLESRSSSGSDSGGPTYYPVVRFLADGEKVVSFTDKLGTSPSLYQSGDVVKVLYDPERPGKAMIDRGLFNCLPAVALIGAGGLMSWWLLFILAGILGRRRYGEGSV